MVPYSTSDAVRVVKLLLFALSGLCALSAVPTAVFLLAFRPQYRNTDNVVMTLIAAVPLTVTMFVLLIFILGATGGRIH